MIRDTIFASASGFGRSAVSIIRLSGPTVGDVLQSLLRAPLPKPRRASLRSLHDPRSGEVLDRGLVLWMPGPSSFTGEDQAELQVHGSIAVRAALLRVLADQPLCRAAEPGEFTRRAFANGRLDLSAVEGLADLIDAETEAQRRQALRQLEGRLAEQVETWRILLLEALASCEAELDFADEEDVPTNVSEGAVTVAATVRAEIVPVIEGAARGEKVREGFQVVIAGAPNSGKSTLLNAVARRDVAIVSPVPGTTRDAIEVRCDLAGLPVTFVDTAGLRASADVIEQEGMNRARQRMRGADLILWLVASDDRQPAASSVDQAGGISSTEPATTLRVATKSDLGPPQCGCDLTVSALSGSGLSELLARIQAIAASALTGGSDALLTRERHRRALTDVVECLDRAVLVGQGTAIELLAEELRLALRHLGRITGAVDVEDVLDRIFASFCIGK